MVHELDYDGTRNPDRPVIGYDNQTTTGNVATDEADASFPAIRLANTATHEVWKGVSENSQAIEVNALSGEIDYVGVVKQNFAAAGISVAVDGSDGVVDTNVKLLLRFEGTNGATTMVDDSGHVFTAHGAATLETGLQKRGNSCLVLPGSTADWIDTPDSADFTLGTSDFALETWFQVNGSGTGQFLLGGQSDNAATAATLAWFVERQSGVGNSFIRAIFGVGAGNVSVTSTSQFSNLVNPGWHHLAITRSGSTFRLFIDGVQEGTATSSGTINDSANKLSIGRLGELVAANWLGRIDDFRLTVGSARYTANFTPPALSLDALTWTQLVAPVVPTDDSPLIVRFTPTSAYAAVRLRLGAGSAIPQAASFYVGKLLVLPRTIYVGHTPITLGRQTNVVAGISENGQFLGRVIVGSSRKNQLPIKNIRPDWYRSEFDPFVVAAQEDPFFFAWRPDTYPLEVGYSWLTGDPVPSNLLPNGMMQVSLDMGAIS